LPSRADQYVGAADLPWAARRHQPLRAHFIPNDLIHNDDDFNADGNIRNEMSGRRVITAARPLIMGMSSETF
jgi:hypothetical protein